MSSLNENPNCCLSDEHHIEKTKKNLLRVELVYFLAQHLRVTQNLCTV